MKKEYEELRGGYYMTRIEDHLREKNIERSLDEKSLKLLKSLEKQPP